MTERVFSNADVRPFYDDGGSPIEARFSCYNATASTALSKDDVLSAFAKKARRLNFVLLLEL